MGIVILSVSQIPASVVASSEICQISRERYFPTQASSSMMSEASCTIRELPLGRLRKYYAAWLQETRLFTTTSNGKSKGSCRYYFWFKMGNRSKTTLVLGPVLSLRNLCRTKHIQQTVHPHISRKQKGTKISIYIPMSRATDFPPNSLHTTLYLIWSYLSDKY